MNNPNSLDKKTLAYAVIALLGFGLLQGARLLDLNTGPYSPQPYALVGLVADGLTFMTVAILSYFGRIDKARPLFRSAVAALVVYAVLSVAGSTNSFIALLAQAAAGIGWSLSILCWMEVFTSFRPRYSMLMIALSFVVNTCVPPLTNALIPEGRAIALVVVLLLATGALFYCLRHNAYIAQKMKEDIAPQTSMAETMSRTKRAVLGAFAFSFVCGFILEIDIYYDLQYAQTDLTAFFGIAAALIIVAILLILKPKKANVDFISPIAVVFLVSVLLYRSLGEGSAATAGSLMTTALMSFYVLLWLMLISDAYERKLPAFFLLGIALGVARLSVALGRFVAQVLLDQGMIGLQPALMGSAWLLVVALSLIFCGYLVQTSNTRKPHTDDALEEAPEKTVSHAPVVLLDCLKETFHLSNRECEMIGEFAAGRSARHIADHFVLSEHTVKTHLRHAYAKMDVHSRQELLDVIEGLEASGSSTAQSRP